MSLPATRPCLHCALPCEESQKTCNLPLQTFRGETGSVDHRNNKAILPCTEDNLNCLEEESYEQREQLFCFPLLIPHGESDDVDCTNAFLFHFQVSLKKAEKRYTKNANNIFFFLSIQPHKDKPVGKLVQKQLNYYSRRIA